MAKKKTMKKTKGKAALAIRRLKKETKEQPRFANFSFGEKGFEFEMKNVSIDHLMHAHKALTMEIGQMLGLKK